MSLVMFVIQLIIPAFFSCVKSANLNAVISTVLTLRLREFLRMNGSVISAKNKDEEGEVLDDLAEMTHNQRAVPIETTAIKTINHY